MSFKPRPRTVLQVTRVGDDVVEIALVVGAPPDEDKRTLLIHPEDVPVLIDLLRAQVDDGGDPEDRSTLRSLKPVVVT